MALKSYSNLKKKKGKKSRRTKDLITGAVTAIIGIGLLSETASAVRRI